MSDTAWDADCYQTHAAFVPALAKAVLQRLNPQAHESILDVGCGDGGLSLQIAESGCELLCIDASPSMVDSACGKGLKAEAVDGQALQYQQRFDAVFSNAALHWMRQPEVVLSGIFNALKPGGRLVAEFGGEGNIQHLVEAMEQVFADHPDWGPFNNPWYFPSVDEYRECLESQGFQVSYCASHRRPTTIEGSLRGWLEVFCQGICGELTESQREAFYTETEQRLLQGLDKPQQTLTLEYVRLTVEAFKPT